jgi:RNA polymerase sigma factor (sigma-70 family)
MQEDAPKTDVDGRLAECVAREQSRLRHFIRRWLPEEADVEDVLQDVFYELVEAQRMVTPLRQTGAWLFRVARNRITDLFRRRRAEAAAPRPEPGAEAGQPRLDLDDWLPSDDAGPEAAYARRVLLEELEAALEELPAPQRAVFLAHELEGRSFKDLAAATGVPVNTLISRKHYAVLYLRRRLRAIYEEYGNG